MVSVNNINNNGKIIFNDNSVTINLELQERIIALEEDIMNGSRDRESLKSEAMSLSKALATNICGGVGASALFQLLSGL